MKELKTAKMKANKWQFEKFVIETKSYGEFAGLQVGKIEFKKPPSGLNDHILLSLPPETTDKIFEIIKPLLNEEIKKLII